MFSISPTTRIAFSLACLTVTAMLSAALLGFLPDHRSGTLIARTRQVETIAVHFSAMARQADPNQLGDILVDLIARNPELQSVGIRRTSGHYLIEAGDHQARWKSDQPELHAETQIKFPIYHDTELWGTVEARYQPITTAWFPGFAPSRKLLGALYVGGLSWMLFQIFLRKILSQMNPEGVVPRRVSQALDALAEGLLILDEKGHIVLANAAFADAVARTRDELIGQPISQFTWKSQSQEELPWNRAQQHGETITSSLIHSAEPLSRIYEVSAVPIQDESGTVRGSMVSFEDVTEREMQKADLLKRMDDVRSFHDSNPAEPAEDVSLPGHRSTIVSVSAAETVMHDLNELGTCLSEQDFDRIAAITEHMKQSATELGAERLKTKAHNLQTAVLSDSDMLDILQMARELTEECRDLQVQ